MSIILQNQLNQLSSKLAKIGVKLDQSSPRQKYSFLYAYYECMHGDDSALPGLVECNVSDSNAKKGITGIFIDGETDGIVAVVPFHLGDFETNSQCQECVKLLHEAESQLEASTPDASPLFANKKIAKRLHELEFDSFSKSHPVKIVLLSDDEKLSMASVRKVRRFIEEKSNDAAPIHTGVEFALVTSDDIEGAILETESPKQFVEKATIRIDKGGNVCHFGQEDSMVVNISAKSVKSLYEQYHYAGLFAQNLRYYVRMPSVDTPISNTISETPEKFWYFNNGIIIICDDYTIKPDTNEVQLSNFSIINGGQTTKLIGDSDFSEDFFLLCKIIKNKSPDPQERMEFIATVAEASNRQKTIKEEDLISNKPAHRLLKEQLAKANVFCRIKRGERINKKAYPEPWQNTTNKEIAQYLMSFMYQEPGLVRNSVANALRKRCAKLVFDDKIISTTQTYSTELLIDLLKFASYLKEWSLWIKVHEQEKDPDKVAVISNSYLFMVALFGLTVKYWCNRSLIKTLSDCQNTEQIAQNIRQYDISHRIFNEGCDNQKYLIQKLLVILCNEILLPAFREYKKYTEPSIVPSNFTKRDTLYYSQVIKKAIDFFEKNPIEPGNEDNLNSIVNPLFHKLSTDEFNKNQKLQCEYGVNYGPKNKPEAKIKDKKLREKAKTKLQKLRKKVANNHNVKVNDVFNGKMLAKLVALAPCNDEELSYVRFDDKYKIKEKIFDISKESVKSCMPT